MPAIGIKHFMNSLQSILTPFTQVRHNFWTSQVVWSQLKSTSRCQVKSSRVGCAQVNHRRLGVILASSQVTFLYLSDLQVCLQLVSQGGYN